VSSKFEDTSISHLRYYSPGSNAESYYKRRKSDGTLPVASKPAKKKSPDKAEASVTVQPVPVSANLRRYRRYRGLLAHKPITGTIARFCFHPIPSAASFPQAYRR
jgi:hypothetical protein